MNQDYSDIRRRIAEPPRWFDENGVPRYDAFTPWDVANIYAREAVLFRIACQSCGAKFEVAMAQERYRWNGDTLVEPPPLSDSIRNGALHYGDPPNAGCCACGPSMNCEDLRVLEYWWRGNGEWTRESSLEIPLADADDFVAPTPPPETPWNGNHP